jgi:hypothetical protein
MSKMQKNAYCISALDYVDQNWLNQAKVEKIPTLHTRLIYPIKGAYWHMRINMGYLILATFYSQTKVTNTDLWVYQIIKYVVANMMYFFSN